MTTKQYIFVKESPNIQLAHLYEHIFCERAYQFMASKHLYQYIDYDLTAKTYYGGVVCVEILSYGSIQDSWVEHLLNMNIEFDNSTISLGVTQLMAEKEAPFGMTGIDKVREALGALHSKQWVDINNVEIIDAKRIRKHPYPFYIAEGAPLKAKKMNIKLISSIDFALEKRLLLPLYRQISQALMMNIQALVCTEYGTYSEDNKFILKNKTAYLVQDFKVANDNEGSIDMDAILSSCQNMYKDIVNNGGIKKLSQELRDIDYSVLSSQPSLQSNYEDTLTFIGPKGWSVISTPENVNEILSSLKIEVAMGRQKKLAELEA